MLSRFLFGVWALALGLSLHDGVARADGMYAPLVGDSVANTADQQALLVFGESSTQLVLRTGYSGNGQPFSWVVPIKGRLTREQVRTVDPLVFRSLDRFSAPQLLEFTLNCGTYLGCGAESSEADAARPAGVGVLDSFRVDDFEISVVEADAGADLVEWLDGRNYRVPEGGAAVFEDYVQRGFDFVAVQYTPSADQSMGQQDGDGSSDQEPSAADPPEDIADALAFTFPEPMYTFPLVISKLSTQRRVEVLLFTIGASRFEAADGFETFDMQLPESYQGDDFDGYYREQLDLRLRAAGGRAFATEYAGPLPGVLWDTLAAEEVLPARPAGTQSGMFLTRLRTRLDAAEMDRDVLLTPVLGDAGTARHRIRVIIGYREPDTLDAILLPLDMLAILGLAWLAGRVRRPRRRR